MPSVVARRRLWMVLVVALTASCTDGNTPHGAVESYLEALVASDTVRAINVSCAAWEEQARTEAASFESVQVSLEGMACAEAGTSGEYTLVTCTGKILAVYNGEQQELSLEGRTYRTLQEAGDWKMCGYQ